MDDTTHLMTPAEARALLKIKKATLYSWTTKGILPHVRLAPDPSSSRGLLRFDREELQRWIAARRKGHRDGNE